MAVHAIILLLCILIGGYYGDISLIIKIVLVVFSGFPDCRYCSVGSEDGRARCH